MSELYELLTFEAFGQRYPELTSRHQILPGRGVFCKAQRLLTMTEQEKEYSLQLREMHQTQVDMRQNQIMKILTIVTTVFLPLSLIAGWYGMNFQNMPELTAEHGYLVICIVSVVCVLVELWIFKRKKWF